MKGVAIITLALFASLTTYGQVNAKYQLSSQEVSGLRKALLKKMDGKTRIDTLLRLAKYYFEQGGGDNAVLDSASIYITNAKEINEKQFSGTYDGLISLYEATLARRKDNPEAARELVNSAIPKFQMANDEFHLTEAYLELSRCYGNDDPQVKNVFNTLFQLVPERISKKMQDSCMSAIVNFFYLQIREDSYAVVIYFLNQMVRSYKVLNNKRYEFWARKEIADEHFQQGQYDIAVKQLLQIAKEQEAGGYPNICFTYDLLAGFYYSEMNYTKALYYALESVKSVRTAVDSAFLSLFYARAALIYRHTGSAEETIEWTTKSLNYALEKNDTDKFYSLLFEYSNGMIDLKRASQAVDFIISKSRLIPPKNKNSKMAMSLALGMCYRALHRYDLAEKHAEEVIMLYEQLLTQKETGGNAAAHQFLAELYFDIGEYDKAEKYMKKALVDWHTGLSARTTYRHYFLSKLESARGNYYSAFNHLRKFHKLFDSVATAAKTKQIEELKISYATEQKDSMISLNERNIQLLKEQDQLQKSKLRQGSILRNISFAVVALSIIVISLLYNKFRVKQRTNRKLESQQAEIEKQNLSLQHLVSEKDWLLKEIHHRVKNNLQVVMSLLNSQSAFIDNESALTAIHDSQHRVHAMSLIHQKLYNSESLSSIDISFYIRELASYLRDSFNTGQRVHFEFDIEPVQMDVSQAVPLGLILNEAITNSIKYAFPNGRNGIISISLAATKPNEYLMIISDNGIGISSGFDFSYKKQGSLGMSLMEGLSADLDGDFSIENKNGTIITVSFIHNPVVNQHDSKVSQVILNN